MAKSQNTGIKFCRESQLLAPVARFARRQGFLLQTVELQFYEYRIDLYGFSREKNATVAIELKLNDWRRALEQAMLYQLCSDYVYIAMPEGAARRANTEALSSNGIGLLAVVGLGECWCVLPAAKHKEVREFYRRTQIKYLQDVRHA